MSTWQTDPCLRYGIRPTRQTDPCLRRGIRLTRQTDPCLRRGIRPTRQTDPCLRHGIRLTGGSLVSRVPVRAAPGPRLPSDTFTPCKSTW